MAASRGRVFDAHLHIVDPRFPVTANDGYLPPTFTAEHYRRRVADVGVVGGAVVSGSFQGFDQEYLFAALRELGPGFVGVTQLPPTVPDERIRELAAAGVRAVRFNVRRRGAPRLRELERFARRVFDVAGWHAELYVDARVLRELAPTLATLPAVSIDHLGLATEALPQLLRLAERGVRVKASGFGRVTMNVANAVRSLAHANPHALMFGTDLPSTRAARPFLDEDLDLLADAVGAQHASAALHDNAVGFYRLDEG